ncbi:hypothetical protein AB0M12_16670 [Nocardia vinacea]|uniref:hypothetical protein n=1 Tax=Nocardia vinacea TaxID=96468 RepID=UPI0034149061
MPRDGATSCHADGITSCHADDTTREYVGRRYPDAAVWVLNHGDIAADLAELTLDDEHPDVIVIGGAGAEFTHDALSRVAELAWARAWCCPVDMTAPRPTHMTAPRPTHITAPRPTTRQHHALPA